MAHTTCNYLTVLNAYCNLYYKVVATGECLTTLVSITCKDLLEKDAFTLILNCAKQLDEVNLAVTTNSVRCNGPVVGENRLEPWGWIGRHRKGW